MDQSGSNTEDSGSVTITKSVNSRLNYIRTECWKRRLFPDIQNIAKIIVSPDILQEVRYQVASCPEYAVWSYGKLWWYGLPIILDETVPPNTLKLVVEIEA